MCPHQRGTQPHERTSEGDARARVSVSSCELGRGWVLVTVLTHTACECVDWLTAVGLFTRSHCYVHSLTNADTCIVI
jgi:hypothetical protein